MSSYEASAAVVWVLLSAGLLRTTYLCIYCRSPCTAFDDELYYCLVEQKLAVQQQVDDMHLESIFLFLGIKVGGISSRWSRACTAITSCQPHITSEPPYSSCNNAKATFSPSSWKLAATQHSFLPSRLCQTRCRHGRVE